MELFHGNFREIRKPEIISTGFYKDFGYGFYCVSLEKQAQRWALSKRPEHVINIYEYEENKDLRIKVFESMTEEWLDFVISCRNGDLHHYDIVEGPMADDTIWDYIEDFIQGNITREAFWVLVKFKYPTRQLVFCNNKALKTLEYVRCYKI